jgi:hypothetical protein
VVQHRVQAIRAGLESPQVGYDVNLDDVAWWSWQTRPVPRASLQCWNLVSLVLFWHVRLIDDSSRDANVDFLETQFAVLQLLQLVL